MPLSELQQINAIVGLSMRIAGWPSTLADLGYILDRIELKFRIRHPTEPRKTIQINPDLLFVQDQRNFSLIVELKSGRFQDFNQLDRFVRIKPIDLVRDAGLTLGLLSQISKHKTGVIQVVNSEFLDEYLAEFQRINHKACLISIDKSAIQIKHGYLPDTPADQKFKQGISLIGFHIPMKLIPVLPTTNDQYELISSIVYGVRELWVNSTRSATLSQIAMNQFKQLWECFDKEAQERYLGVAKVTLKDMQETEFYEYLRPVPSRPDKWTLLNLPDQTDERHRTRAYQRFKAAIDTYNWRRKNNKPYAGRHPAQTTMADVEGWIPTQPDSESEPED